jgi:hypothetical protein
VGVVEGVMEQVKFEDLKGKTLTNVTGKVGDDEMLFKTDTGEEFKLYHMQDCCESVTIEDIVGDLSDLVGSPILEAEESTSDKNPTDAKPETLEYQDSFTWTFYKIGTIKGSVAIRWYGESNGYYSESVDFDKVEH